MPPNPLAKLLGLILVLAGPLALPAQTSPAEDKPPAPATQLGGAGRLWTETPTPPPSGEVVPAAYQTPAFPEHPESKKSGPPPAGASPAGAAPAATASSALSARDAPLALAPRGRGARTESSGKPGPVGGLSSLLTIGSSLALVLGLFFVVAWVLRRASPRGSVLLPAEVVEVLGRAPLAGRQQMHLLRCGNKLLLVCVTPEGAETLTEITDPDEVTRLAGLCRQAQPNSATTAFRQVFQQFAKETKPPGPLQRGAHEDLLLASAAVPSVKGGRLEDSDA